MQAAGTKKTRQASGLLLALVASASMLGGCGEGVFFASENPNTTTAAATDGVAPTPTSTPTPGSTTTAGSTAGTTSSGTTPAPSGGTTPTPTPAPSGGTAPTPPPPAGGGTTPTPTPPPPAPTPTPSAGSIGKTLWVNNCQGCHGGNTGKGANAGTTLAAIAEPKNKFGMGFLSGSIGATEASQIATYAANPGAY